MTLSFADCRIAAAVVRRSPRARQVIDTVRPAGGVAALRSRAPLAYTLWVADRDDLVIWFSIDAFALVEPHGPARPTTFEGGIGPGVARLIDRNWSLVATHMPTVVLLVAAGALLVPVQTRIAGLLCAVAMLAYLAVIMAAGLLRPLGRALRHGPKTEDELLAESPSAQWSVPLLHAEDPLRVPDLLRAVEAKVRAHTRVAGRAADGRLSTEAAGGRRQPAIVLRAGAITTDAARAAAGTAGADILLRPDGTIPPRRFVVGVDFLLMYAAGVALAVVVCAEIVAGRERDACAPECAGRPATFGSALRLLLQRLWFTDPANLHPGTAGGTALGWLISALTVVTAMVAVAAIRQTIARQRAAWASFDTKKRDLMNANTVVFTALEVEYNAVAGYVTGRTEREVAGTLYEIGDHNGRRVAIVQTGAGNARAAFEVERARSTFRPEIMIFVGVAGGRKDVDLGDVVAADAIYDYESGKDDRDGLRPRFKTYHSSHRMVQRAQSVARTGAWPNRLDGQPRAYVKPLAAGGKVVADNLSYTAKLIAQNAGDAVAVEMEGFGFLQGVHASAGTDAIVIRGISDLLSDKTPERDELWQPIAARNAAAFAFALLDELNAG